MKICLLNRFFDVQSNAGLGRVANELSTRLEERGHEVIRLASPHAKTLWGYFFDTHIYRYFKLPKDVDVYHALTPLEAIGPVQKNYGYKTLTTIEDIIPVTHPKQAGAGMQKNAFYNFVSSAVYGTATYWCLRNTRRIVTPSNYTAGLIARQFEYDRASIDVIQLGISKDYRPLSGLKRSNHTVIGYVGQLDYRKRVHLLIQAFLEADIDATLWIGGTGPEWDKLQRLANGDKRVLFEGFIPEQDMAQWYNLIDLLVFPSAVEGYGLPPVEAMACGTPVVVLKDAAIPDDVKDNCIVTDDLVTTLRTFKRNRHKGDTAKMKWAQSHDWDKTVDEYERIYREIAY